MTATSSTAPFIFICPKGLILNPVVKVKVLAAQSCPTLCNPIDSSPPGSFVHVILQARILSGLSFPSSGDLPNPGIKPRSPALQTDSSPSEPPGKPEGLILNPEVEMVKAESCLHELLCKVWSLAG